MKSSELDYELPQELIAQHPLERRDSSRLLVYDRSSGESRNRRFDELRSEILGHFDEVYRRLERLEQEYQTIIQTLRRIEALLVDERVRREILERDLASWLQET